MNDDKMAELVLKITSELATLNAHMKVVLDRLSLQEQRITVMIIGSLTGASALIKGVFGM